MTWDAGPDEPEEQTSTDEALSPEQLWGLQCGVAASIMPAADGWRVHYFSLSDFDSQPGTSFPSFDEALAAIKAVLPHVNSPEQRVRAQQELREFIGDVMSSDE